MSLSDSINSLSSFFANSATKKYNQSVQEYGIMEKERIARAQVSAIIRRKPELRNQLPNNSSATEQLSFLSTALNLDSQAKNEKAQDLNILLAQEAVNNIPGNRKQHELDIKAKELAIINAENAGKNNDLNYKMNQAQYAQMTQPKYVVNYDDLPENTFGSVFQYDSTGKRINEGLLKKDESGSYFIDYNKDGAKQRNETAPRDVVADITAQQNDLVRRKALNEINSGGKLKDAIEIDGKYYAINPNTQSLIDMVTGSPVDLETENGKNLYKQYKNLANNERGSNIVEYQGEQYVINDKTNRVTDIKGNIIKDIRLARDITDSAVLTTYSDKLPSMARSHMTNIEEKIKLVAGNKKFERAIKNVFGDNKEKGKAVSIYSIEAAASSYLEILRDEISALDEYLKDGEITSFKSLSDKGLANKGYIDSMILALEREGEIDRDEAMMISYLTDFSEAAKVSYYARKLEEGRLGTLMNTGNFYQRQVDKNRQNIKTDLDSLFTPEK